MRWTRWVAAAVTCVALGATQVPAQANDGRPVLKRPQVDGTAVVLKGRSHVSGPVRLQERRDGAWRRAATVRADGRGRYAVTRPVPVGTTRYRTVVDGVRSRVRKVVPPAVAGDACGPLLPKDDGGSWSCTLAEEFDGAALDRDLWLALDQAGPADGACNVDSPRTVEVADGTLRLTVRPVEAGLECPPRPDGTRSSYASGSVTTYARWSQQYGRFEARMKVADTRLPGLQEAFWMWPDARYTDAYNWPTTGEIDIVETYSQHPDLAIPYLHYNHDDNGGPIAGTNTAWHCATTRGEFHTYALEWTADRLEIFVDGRSCLVNEVGASSFRKPFILALTQLLDANFGSLIGTPEGASVPATMEVDYVRVWE